MDLGFSIDRVLNICSRMTEKVVSFLWKIPVPLSIVLPSSICWYKQSLFSNKLHFLTCDVPFFSSLFVLFEFEIAFTTSRLLTFQRAQRSWYHIIGFLYVCAL